MRELKQNPYAAVRHVLAASEPFAVTSRGYDTGVVIQSAAVKTNPQRFVSGEVLNAMRDAMPLSVAEAQAWKDDIEAAIGDDGLEDVWERP